MNDDFFEFAFAVIGDSLTAYANGKQILDARDSKHGNVGWPGVHSTGGRGSFRDIEVQTLERVGSAPEVNVGFAEPPRKQTPATLPNAPAESPFRWLCYSIHDHAAVEKIAHQVNVLEDRSWQQHDDATIRTARKFGIPVIVTFAREEFPNVERKLFDLIVRNRDVVAAVNFLAPYNAQGGFTPNQIDDFGRRLKGRFPGISYWVSYPAMPFGMKEPLPAVPPEVDVVSMNNYFNMSPDQVTENVEKHLPAWLGRAGKRPLVLRWVSKPTSDWDVSQGDLRTGAGTINQCGELAVRHMLAGLVFDQYGKRPDNWSPGIDTDPTASAEVRALATKYGFLNSP